MSSLYIHLILNYNNPENKAAKFGLSWNENVNMPVSTINQYYTSVSSNKIYKSVNKGNVDSFYLIFFIRTGVRYRRCRSIKKDAQLQVSTHEVLERKVR